MKRNLLIVFMIFISISAFSRPVYLYYKEGGKFTFNFSHGFYIGYDAIHTDVLYKNDANGNPIEEIHITCTNPGAEPCRNSINSSSGVVVDNNSFDPSFIDDILSEMNTTIDDKVINEKITKGSLNKKVSIVSREGNQCLLSFDAIWNVNENGDGEVKIEINEIKF